MADDVVRVTYWVKGVVQGVGFRWWTRSQALELGLVGYARNLTDGRVEVCAQGPRAAVDELGARLSPQATVIAGRRRPGHVEVCIANEGDVRDDLTGFAER